MRKRPAKPLLLPCQSSGTKTATADSASVVDSPEEPARLVLSSSLIHQLEVEVEVVDRVPAKIGADEPSPRMLGESGPWMA